MDHGGYHQNDYHVQMELMKMLYICVDHTVLLHVEQGSRYVGWWLPI